MKANTVTLWGVEYIHPHVCDCCGEVVNTLVQVWFDDEDECENFALAVACEGHAYKVRREEVPAE